MSQLPLQTQDFWRVNSYGYPNPFNRDTKSQEAWATFCSFYKYNKGSYSSLKAYWESTEAPRKLDSHAVESWKATFEEFGLLYVISRSNTITVTPAGDQFYEAAQRQNEQEFVWIGLNLLFRYPVKGPPRGRSKSAAHAEADILPYRFLHSAMRDLGDYFWWTELERIFCRVFLTSEANAAVSAIRRLRANPSALEEFTLPVDKRKGAFYNSLNQVANHAGMNHFAFMQDDESEHYGPNESRRRHFINRDFLSLISVALGDAKTPSDCGASATYVDRLPTAPHFDDEQAYFDYLGALVPNMTATGGSTGLQAITLSGDTVFILKVGEHFEAVSVAEYERIVQGSTLTLCRIARNHRIVLSTDSSWTYFVTGKDLVGPNTVKLSLRRARPITNMEPIKTLFGGGDA
ncbi:hypothetical protein [Bryobacter aggregatus]|uniref:hypothetical protein n=1 Tax=Bryobacter aggregatus TaxID=360054 RepID=UPI0004E10F9B|nr:hypothetical protein [Bryobacter aggregatus]